MKIPYLKIYTADLLAVNRKLNPEQIGSAILGICEQAFDNQTQYEPKNEAERAFYDMLLGWKNESIKALKIKKLAGKKGGTVTQARHKLSDGSTACFSASSKQNKQTETDTETETETDINKLLTAGKPQGSKVVLEPKPKKLNDLQKFSNAVIENFEPEVQTDGQKAVWFKRNCRCLSDILRFCGGDIDMALGCIYVCATRLKKANLRGGYEAVCRNLPDYYSEAKKLQEAPYAN